MDVQFQAEYGGMRQDTEGCTRVTFTVDASSAVELVRSAPEMVGVLLTVKVSNG